ncbi:phage tail protein [Pseudoalteromonas ruthenica]|uniref:phage tail protein n=1 Tax=Pseudoalteromonas ruthenica TaxID=151081 RepID=UPI00110B117C|nr:phage tail protein [Pseudoalteromonas ruthenica]TMO97542.1 phage tail protein [Pseudoalteromonas ruthenica]
MDKPVLPSWLDQEDVSELARIANDFWQKVEQQFYWWLEQLHDENAQEQILTLLAFERDIKRLPGEELSLFGKRVKYALTNAQDAGFSLGMERIFKRLGFGYVAFNERVAGYDWDMIEVQMLESEYASQEPLVQELIAQYGRTCRRYFLSALTTVQTVERLAVIEFDKEVVF